MTTTNNTKFAEAILDLVGEKPRLLNDIISDLRDRRWRNVRSEDVERIAREYGAFIRGRTHGTGIAVYVAAANFTEVETRYGLKPVHPC